MGYFYDFDYGYGSDFDDSFFLAISECLDTVDLDDSLEASDDV